MLYVLAALVVTSLVAQPLRARMERWRTRRWFRSVPRRTVDACVEGELVRVVGIVTAAEVVLAAPSDGAQCVYYASFFRPRWLVGRGLHGQRAMGCAFWLDADGQWVRISSAGGAGVHLGARAMRRAESGAATAEIRRELALVASDFATPPAESQTRYSEARLVVGERIAVVGRAVWGETKNANRELSSAYRGGVVPLRVLCIVPGPGERLQMTDDAGASV